jgi:hypothetical protein
VIRHRLILSCLFSLFGVTGLAVLGKSAEHPNKTWIAQKTGDQAIADGQQLSRQADGLLKQGDEREAARLYLAAHEKYQKKILEYFEQAFRASLGGGVVDEDALTKASTRAADLRNVNLSKLWVVVDPDDRAFEQGFEAERGALLQRFDEFTLPASAGPLEQFLIKLYPEDASGDRQMDALRGGSLPASKRWTRLEAERAH